jgi:tetratricopeptide (TPR) repeat protein
VKITTRFLAFIGVFCFGGAAVVAIRLAVAETLSRRNTLAAVQRAINLESPAPAAELEQMVAELDPVHARAALERAVETNPRSSAAWIALGLLEETNDWSAAEKALRQAALLDHQYLPAWTLANFYFRRANREQFWVWADRAASLAYDDLQPLLRLCDQFEPDAALMLAHFHDPGRLRAPYLNFLIGNNRLDAAQQVARAMLGERTNDPYLIGLADRQLGAGNAASAIELWNAAAGFPPIEPAAGRVLTNGDLRRAPLNLGFDWRVRQSEGITQNWRPSELVFTFSGSQPEACVLLEQTIYVVPRHFRLRFDYLTVESSLEGEPATTGLRWALDNIEGPRIEPSSRWTEGAFDLPRARGLRNLRLFYRRETGTTRTEGRIEVRNLRLEASS